MNKLKDLDRELFLYLNSQHSPFWDKIMVAASDKYFWVPFYILLLGFLIYKFRKQSYVLVGAIAFAIAAADSFSSAFLKPLVSRLRPCHEASLAGLMNVVDRCGGKFGFVSSHAANSFALALLLTLVLDKKYNLLKLLLFAWAIVVSYSRVYLGVHYPGDIAGGALLGLATAYLAYLLFRTLIRKFFPKPIHESYPG